MRTELTRKVCSAPLPALLIEPEPIELPPAEDDPLALPVEPVPVPAALPDPLPDPVLPVPVLPDPLVPVVPPPVAVLPVVLPPIEPEPLPLLMLPLPLPLYAPPPLPEPDSSVPRTSTRELTFFCRSFSLPTRMKELPELYADCDPDWLPVILPLEPEEPDPLVPVVDPPVIDPPDEPLPLAAVVEDPLPVEPPVIEAPAPEALRDELLPEFPLPMDALVKMKLPLDPDELRLLELPLVPVVPLMLPDPPAPEVRQPVTVTVSLWLLLRLFPICPFASCAVD